MSLRQRVSAPLPVNRVLVGDCLEELARLPDQSVDLVFADPPYDVGAGAIETIVEHLGAPGWLSPGATVSIERPVGSGVLLPKTFRTGWERTFGDTLVFFVEASDAPA